MRERIPIGIVGVGRTRAGLGPFLAKFCEEEGFLVAGVSGRSLERAEANAEAIGQELGHAVKAFPSPADLCAAGVRALVIASPAAFHLEALQAAADAGLPTLCEKPLVHESHVEQGARVLDTFARNRIPLVENCQWPNVLPAFFQLHGDPKAGEHVRVELGLGPPRLGREMVENTVSHLLSVIQAIAPIHSDAVITDVRISDPTYTSTDNLLQFRVINEATTVEGLLHMKICTVPPRPAWLAINNCRIDRHVGKDYEIAFSANGRKVVIPDPTKQLVRHFAALARSRDSILIDHDLNRIAQRLQWYRQIVGQLE